VILADLKQIVGYFIEGIVVYLTRRSLVKLRLYECRETHQFCNGLAVNFWLLHHFRSFCFLRDKLKQLHRVYLLFEPSKYLTSSKEVALLNGVVVRAQTSNQTL